MSTKPREQPAGSPCMYCARFLLPLHFLRFLVNPFFSQRASLASLVSLPPPHLLGTHLSCLRKEELKTRATNASGGCHLALKSQIRYKRVRSSGSYVGQQRMAFLVPSPRVTKTNNCHANEHSVAHARSLQGDQSSSATLTY